MVVEIWNIIIGILLSGIGTLTLLFMTRLSSDVHRIREEFEKMGLEVARLIEWSKNHTQSDERMMQDLSRRLERVEQNTRLSTIN